MRSTKLFLATALLLSTSFVLSNNALAMESAHARVCRQAGGQPWTVNFNSTEDVMLCRFGAAAIGAAEFAELTWNQVRSASIQTYLDASPSGGGQATCERNDSRYKEAVDSNQTTWRLCVFSDSSVIEASTLARGPQSSQNSSLTRALR